MKDQSGVLIGVCRPLPEVLGFVTPVFRDRMGESVAQIVQDGHVVRFVQVDLGEEFVPLESLASVSVGDPALYGMEFENCIAVGSPISAMTQGGRGAADWSDENAIRAAFETHRYNKSSGFLTFPRPVTDGRKLIVKLAACAAFLCFGVALTFAVLNYPKSERVVATEVGEWDHETLQDGTDVHIDARSKVEVEYTDETRIVHVHEGSAVFEVVKDPKRPFIARTNLVDVTAVGTRFGVSIDAGVTTTVSEGTVTVTRRGHADGTAVQVNAGEKLRVSHLSLAPPRVAPVDAERELEWAKGWLTLSNLTVAEGVKELNSRNRVQIIVDSPTLGAKVVKSARVEVGSPEGYAEAIAEEWNINVTFDMKNNLIRLSE